VVNAASVVCSDATNSAATACNVGFYLASGACPGTAPGVGMGMLVESYIPTYSSCKNSSYYSLHQ
jgi:hypothetical protein